MPSLHPHVIRCASLTQSCLGLSWAVPCPKAGCSALDGYDLVFVRDIGSRCGCGRAHNSLKRKGPCAALLDGDTLVMEECDPSSAPWAVLSDLEPDSKYFVRVRANTANVSLPICAERGMQSIGCS